MPFFLENVESLIIQFFRETLYKNSFLKTFLWKLVSKTPFFFLIFLEKYFLKICFLKNPLKYWKTYLKYHNTGILYHSENLVSRGVTYRSPPECTSMSPLDMSGNNSTGSPIFRGVTYRHPLNTQLAPWGVTYRHPPCHWTRVQVHEPKPSSCLWN